MNNCFILLAAGKGKRFNSKEKKQFFNYKNKPLFMHSIDKAKKSKLFNKIVLVTNKKITINTSIVIATLLMKLVIIYLSANLNISKIILCLLYTFYESFI